jgi:hypothetical protein
VASSRGSSSGTEVLREIILLHSPRNLRVTLLLPFLLIGMLQGIPFDNRSPHVPVTSNH